MDWTHQQKKHRVTHGSKTKPKHMVPPRDASQLQGQIKTQSKRVAESGYSKQIWFREK